MLNAIDDIKTKDGQRMFTPAHFDLIIIDESHRSIFKKYRAIFEYFDAIMVGLTATPKTDVDRNTYDFFEMEHGVPTYAYDYETAVYQDHVLVPYYNYEVKTKFLEEGITYDDLSDEDKERYEDDFIEDGLMPSFKYAQKQLRDIGTLLERKISIPQVKAKLPVIKEVNTDAFWEANDILLFEKVRKELRSLMQFLVEVGPVKNPIITRLSDPIIGEQEGIQLDAAYDFEDYRAKVNRYVNEHGNTLAIYKLTHNIPLSHGDYQELERVLTSELGSKEDYEREFGDTPFGLLIRKIAKLDHDAAMEAFSQFINDQSLNQKQIAFLHKIINHIEQNGYMESVTMLTKPPFDKPLSFTRLFDKKMQIAIMATINKVKDNAVVIAA